MDLKSKKVTDTAQLLASLRFWSVDGATYPTQGKPQYRNQDGPKAADLIEALELALTQSRAETAAVVDRIADEVCRWSLAASEEIRALATPDQTAALDAVRAEARAQGMREAADIAEKGVEVLGLRMREAKDKKEKRDWQSMLFCAVDIKHAILSAIKGAKA